MIHNHTPYSEVKPLASLARQFAAIVNLPSHIPALWLLTDPRFENFISAARQLPAHSGVIYRHFGADNRLENAKILRQICFEKHLTLLIGADPELAINCGADGVHFAERQIGHLEKWRQRCPEWILTCTAHDKYSLSAANKLAPDAVFLSPIFNSESPSAQLCLGVKTAQKLIEHSEHPVIALGGITAQTAMQLKTSGVAGLAAVSSLHV